MWYNWFPTLLANLTKFTEFICNVYIKKNLPYSDCVLCYQSLCLTLCLALSLFSLFRSLLLIRHKTFSRINIHLNDIHGSTRNLSDQIRNIHFVENHLNNGDRNSTLAQILIAADTVALTQYIFIDKTFTKECTTTHTQQLKLKENLAAFRLKKVTLT